MLTINKSQKKNERTERIQNRFFFFFRDHWGRKWSHLVAIDALYYRDPSKQYQLKNIQRDLLKAYTGFYSYGQSQSTAFPVTTGNWGCGAFNGDKELKGRHILLGHLSFVYISLQRSFN